MLILVGPEPGVEGGVVSHALMREIDPASAPVGKRIDGSLFERDQIVRGVVDRQLRPVPVEERRHVFFVVHVSARNPVPSDRVDPDFSLRQTTVREQPFPDS